MSVKFFPSQKDFRKWLEKNHDKKDELWVGYYKKGTGKKSIDWNQSVDEALCFGWIDGIRKSIDEESYMIRFTPRKIKSNWSVKNLKRIDELIKLGQVAPAGLSVYKKRDEKYSGKYSFEQKKHELDKKYKNEFKKNKRAWSFFQKMAPSYKRTAIHWVMSAKREETRLKRLSILIKNSNDEMKIPPLRR